MESEPVTVLLVGAGSRGRTVYGRFALSNPQLARVVAVAEPCPERRQAVASEHGLPPERMFQSWQQAAERGRLAQTAVVATNDRDHVEPAVAFLAQGYHLLLEKPMAPNLEDCHRIVEAAERAEGMSAVCHVLRYTPYFRKLRELIEQDAVGKVQSIRHFEPVNYWHFAHSFVRGNWNNSHTTSPFILAKCCHDMDILCYLMDERPVAVQSFGSLSHFRPEAAPEGAAKRCHECVLKQECPYSANKFYGKLLADGVMGWPLDVFLSTFDPASLDRALRHGPYGRCVYHCDNDVCDHQVVNLEFESGGTASLLASAFTEVPARETDVMGSAGMLRGDGVKIVWKDFRRATETVCEVESGGGHLGGDEGMLREFFAAVSSGKASRLTTTPRRSLLSHQMALLAERSRLERRLVFFQEDGISQPR